MSVKFSEDGPDFPEALVDSFLSGEVVFLCGAGVSAPQLPTFAGLVEECFRRLNVVRNASEDASFSDWRYEEVLGSLSRRVVDPTHMISAIVDMLQPQPNMDLSNHHTILRLSRDLDNRPAIITTNFDTMLEQALLELEPAERVRELSFAGQDLPLPGSASFCGIIHLHGRIADSVAELDQTPIVVTSADYGDAYMRSGWASRFLFDLCRCRTIVLVGYSAGDAPVRYFLNVLEADRQRFPDLRPVYAFDSVAARGSPETRWGALAVKPLLYELGADPVTAERNDHTALWRDLAQLADLVERPRATRLLWAQQILLRPYADATPTELARVSWLLRGSRDLWSVVFSSIEDASWFNYFVNEGVWSLDDLAWILAAWIARDFQSEERLGVAIEWSGKLDKTFGHEISNRLDQAGELQTLWRSAWRLIASSDGKRDANYEDRLYALEQRLRDPNVLSSDVRKAVSLLSPKLMIAGRGLPLEGRTASCLSDFFRTRWPVPDQYGAPDLVEALIAVRQPVTVMEIATAELQSVIRNMIDAGAINEDFDRSDSFVPSVEPHRQNDHHDGPVFLVQLLARLLPEIGATCREVGRSYAEMWRRLPSFLGTRLWLHALRAPELFTSDEALAGVSELPIDVFWHVRRELALVLRGRATDADQNVVNEIEVRILREGERYYQRYTISAGQADWRSHARDAEVWLRLQMLSLAGRLSSAGSLELAGIRRRRDYLNREVEDRDFFSSYSSGVRAVVGDPQQIIQADPGERLAVARDVIQSPDITVQLGWSAYCRSDPQGAFDTLLRANFDDSNAPLWQRLIETLSFASAPRDEALGQVIIRIFETLRNAPESFIVLLIDGITSLYLSAPRGTTPSIVDWWPQLFDLAIAHGGGQYDAISDLFEDAINSPAGRLTEALLIDINERRSAGESVDENMLNALSQATASGGSQGTYARCILVRDAAFVLTIDPHVVTDSLNASLSEDSTDAAGLRAVLANSTGLSPSVSSVLNRQILRAVSEGNAQRPNMLAAAAKIMAPAVATIRQEEGWETWGITLEEVSQALRQGSPALRVGAVRVLVQWIGEMDAAGPAEAWRRTIGPTVSRVWPRERDLCEKELSINFAELAVASAEAFPEALELLFPFLSRLDGRGGLHIISHSHVPDTFPAETLALLWRLCGPSSTVGFYGIPQILDRIIQARPETERDRRLQWLNQRAIRF